MNKKKFLLLFVLCCALPLLAAKLVLEFGWFNSGVSSKGEWQQTEVFLLTATNAKAHWRLAVAPKAECDNQCQQALFTIQQLYVGLGRKQVQVQPVLISEQIPPETYTAFTRHSAVQPVPEALQNRILLIDQQGLVLLSYPVPLAQTELASTASAIRQDLLKLLNYDRTSV
ncbi:MAG: hypothetical protein CVV11_20970 [Gammaproteobacteria bacterium HGW-Gammaproteobacteria-15]|nr:MAG: hypothetical protein CVV11_20970 [Gammaproteobacteria bacterium HGW-Gammaproteobacteria-15]